MCAVKGVKPDAFKLTAFDACDYGQFYGQLVAMLATEISHQMLIFSPQESCCILYIALHPLPRSAPSFQSPTL